jgi:probable F420-dependent oxidoreductase
MTVKLGLHIPLEFFTPPQAVECAQLADSSGLALIVVNDHLFLPWTPCVSEAWTVLAAMASVTNQIKLGPCVTPLPLRHPFILAKLSASLDLLSEGRLIMGVGAGWFQYEFKSVKVPYLGLAERHAQTEESIQLLQELWTNPSVTFKGQYYNTDHLSLEPKPVQNPHPPIFLGGNSKTILSFTIKYGEGWMPFSPSVDDLRQKVKLIGKLLQKENRTLDEVQIIPSIPLQFGKDKDSAFQQLPAYLKVIQGSGFNYILGSPSECAEQILAYVKAGANQVILRLVTPSQAAAHIQTMADEIIPILAP